jgi:hypothetical protein
MWNFRVFSHLWALIFFFLGGTWFWTQIFTLAKLALSHLSLTYSSFCFGYFGDGVLWTICPGWPPTVILPISASQVARIVSLSHHLWASELQFNFWTFLVVGTMTFHVAGRECELLFLHHEHIHSGKMLSRPSQALNKHILTFTKHFALLCAGSKWDFKLRQH